MILITILGFLLCTPSFCDVSHLVRQGYGAHKPEHPLELPGEGSHNHDHSVHGYPKTVPDNPLHIPDASTGHVNNQIPDSTGSGTSDGGLSITHQHRNHGHDQGHYDHYNHGQDGRYNPHDDGSAWDIRNSVPGEPGRDYPIYDSVPTTSFTCKDKVPGYYADEEARCQAFSVCTTSSERTYFNFLCPNGTLFNQRVLTCDWWMNVDCAESRQYFFKNEAIGKMPTGSQFKDKVMSMLEAPDNNPYHFDLEQKSHIDYMRQKIHDNDLQGSGPGPIQDLYLPVPESTPAPIPTTTTTTSKPIISESSIGNVNINKQNMLNINTSSSSEEDTRYNLSQFSSRNVTTEEERRKLAQTTDTTITQDPNQVGGKQMHVNQVLHVSNIKPAQKQQGGDLFVTPILSKPSTGGHVSQVLHSNSIPAQTQQGSDPFVTPILSKPSKTDGQLHVSQVLHSNSIPAQKQQGGDPFVTPILSKPFKTDGQPLTSKLPKIPHAPFVSKEKSVDNKLFVSKEKADGKLFTSELKPVNNPQALFVSPVAKQQDNKLFVSKEKTDNKLFTSELKPSLNPQPLFVSRESKPFVSKENTNTINPNKLFISPERTNKTLFISPIAASSDNVDTFVSQIDQSNIGNVKVQNELNQTSSTSLDNTAIIDQGSAGNVNVDEYLNKTRGSQIEPGYEYTRPGPAITGDSSSSSPTGQKIPTLTVTKENTHTVTHSEKTTHVFQDGTQEPQINLLDQSRNVISAQPDPHITTITHSVTGLNRQPEIQQQPIPGVQSQLTITQKEIATGVQPQLITSQQGFSDIQPQLGLAQPTPQFTITQQQPIPSVQPQLTITQKEISTGVQPQLITSQQGISDIQPQLGLPQPTPQFTFPQHRVSNVQPIPSISNAPANLNRDQAIQQIDQIQRGFQQITDQQKQLNQFGFGIINPRTLEQPLPVTNFGQFGSESFPAQSYQGYQFPQQNQPNFHYQQAISRPNFNIEFSKDGSSNNYNGHSLTQHTDGQTHTTFTGNNVAFKESTKVDIVPALGFHLNDAIEKSSYISAVLGGLVNEGPSPSYQRTISATNFQQSPFPPTDVRYSSYQGPSSYLVPQGSVPRLPSDSGYRYR